MSSTQQAPKQIKQYKDFTSVTAIRKFTQQAMAPVIRSLEQQISSMIDQQKQINRKVSKVDDACKSQSLLQQKIQDINKNIDDFKTVQGERKREDDRKFLRLDSVNQKLFLEIHSLKTGIQGQNQIIKQINNKNGKMMEMYNELAATNDKTIKDMQYRYNDFTKDILEMTKNVRQQYQKVLSQIQVIRMTFKTQRGALQEKTRTLELYLSERQSTQQKFEDIYSKIINSVTREDFEGYRKSQKVYIEDLFSEMKHQIQEALPHSLREQLPSIEKKLKQVQKVKKIEKTCTELQLGIDQTVRKITDVSNDFVCKIEQLNKESQDKNSSLQKQFAEKLQQLQQKQFQMTERFQERLQDLKLQIQQEVSGIIQRQTSELQKTIEAQVASNRGGSVKNHVTYDFSARDEDFKKQIEEVRSIKQKVLGRYNKIQEIGQTIDNKIEGYSNKITRIKSDYELFAQNMRKQVSGVIKFRDTFLDRLEDVGKLLSSYTEALFIMTSIFIQKYGEDSTSNNNQAKQPKQSVVFITENDGIIYQSKPQIDKGWIMYRKQKMEIKQFLRSYMYSLITFVDDQFSNLHFLNWKNQKPSAFFKQRVLDNYRTCVKRISQYSQKEKMRRDSCYSISQNQNYFIVDEGQIIINNDPTASTKPFSRTIESKLRFDKVLEEGFQQNEDNRKGYSIKKPKPASGRPSTKQKTTSDKSRYDQMFLSSRSACRSRISQAV